MRNGETKKIEWWLGGWRCDAQPKIVAADGSETQPDLPPLPILLAVAGAVYVHSYRYCAPCRLLAFC